jgi:hypothetical protein
VHQLVGKNGRKKQNKLWAFHLRIGNSRNSLKLQIVVVLLVGKNKKIKLKIEITKL